MSSSNTYTVSHDVELIKPNKTKALLLDKHDWDHAKKKLNEIKNPFQLLLNIGSVFFGIGTSVLIETLAHDTTDTHTPYCYIIGVSSVIISIICYVFGAMKKNMDSTKVKDVIDFMQHIEEKFPSE